MKLDRLLGILTVLLQNRQVTAPFLADKFEVTRRTISRDIDALCRAGIPVVTRQGGGGGISIAEGFKLDKSVLTMEELSGMIAALKGIGSVSDSSEIERTLDKLSIREDAVISLQEPLIIDLASHYKGSLTRKIGLIKRAILEKRLIEFDYYTENGVARRRVEPAFMIFKWTAWYIVGFCADREDFRTFKLARLWGLMLCEERFSQRPIPPEKRDIGTFLTDEHRLVALFDPSARSRLIEDYGPDCYTQTPEGMLRLEVGYTSRGYILSWLLGFGAKAIVLEPLDLADGIRQTAAEMLKNYP